MAQNSPVAKLSALQNQTITEYRAPMHGEHQVNILNTLIG
jgi:hypothetical protein